MKLIQYVLKYSKHQFTYALTKQNLLFLTVLFIIQLFTLNTIKGQNGIITQVNAADLKINICKTNIVEIEITNVTGTVDFNLVIPNTLDIIAAKENGNQLPITTTNWQIPTNNGTAKLLLDLKPKCENYTLGNPTITGQINGNSFSRTYEIIKGDLSYINMTYSPNNGIVDISQVVTRCFEYKNTSDTTFSGRIVFVDTLEKKYDGSWIDFLGVEITNNGGGTVQILQQTETDSSIVLIFNIENLPAESSLIICDSVQLKTCTDAAINRSRTFYSLDYGCIGDVTTCVQTPIGIQPTTTTRANKRPIIDFERINPTRTCQANEDRHIYKIWNKGNGVAQGFDFKYVQSHQNNTPYDISELDIDSANIEFYYYDNSGNKVDIDFQTLAFGSNTYGPYRCAFCKYIRSKNKLIHPGDTIYLEFTERQKCPLVEEDYFPNHVTMQNEKYAGILRHDCKSSSISFANRIDGRYPYYQKYSLSQNIPNLTATITDQQVVDYEVKNLDQLWLSYPNYNYPMYYFDKSTFRLEVELELTPGLCLKDIDSVGLYSNFTNSRILPISYEIINIEDSSCIYDLCGGVTARFRFQLPDNFYTQKWNSYLGTVDVFSQDYLDFFSNFDVQFSVKGECDCSDGSGEAEIGQRFYAIYDTTCTDLCRIPINQVGEELTLNCPGCFVPGWNLSNMELYRLNVDMSDTDDNHYPDNYPMQTANPQDVRTDRIMLGDTVKIDIDAFSSDGDPSLGGYTFGMNYPSQSGFEYLFGQFSLEGTLIAQLDLLEISGELDDNGTVYPFTISGTTLSNLTHKNGDLLLLQLDIADWAMILGNNNFAKYNGGQELDINFIFEVTGNLTTGGGLPPYMSRYDVVGRFHMSGTDFSNTVLDANTNGNSKFDALNSFPNSDFPTANDVKDLTISERQGLFYWCTHWESRITGVGIDNVFGANANRGYYQNTCLKRINAGFIGSTGQSVDDYKKKKYQVYDAFSFELRNIWMLDSFTIDLPNHYKISRVLFNNNAIWKNNGISQQSDLPTPNVNLLQNKDFTPPNNLVTTYNDVFTFHLHDFLDKINTAPVLPNGTFNNNAYQLFSSFYGENKRVGVTLEFIPEDCQFRPTGIENLDVAIHVQNDPFHGFGNHTYLKTIGFDLSRGNPIFSSDISNVQIGANGVDLSFDAKILAVNIGHDYTPNTFVYFTSSTSGISVNRITNSTNSTTTVLISSLLNNGEPIYHLGNNSAAKMIKNIHVEADYDCSQVSDNDTIMMIVGYGCEGYVTDLNDACRLDTFYIPIAYQSPGLNTTQNLNVSNSTCDTATYNITFDATGTINVENVIANISLPQGASLASNTGVLLFDNQQFNVTTTSTSNPFIFEMVDLVNFSGRDANLTTATLTIPILFSCDYDNGIIQTEVTATDFCGKDLPSINLTSPIVNNLQKVDFSKVVLSNFEYQLITDCEQPANYVITIQNNNNSPSGDFQIDYYCTEDNNGALSPKCFIGSSNTLNLTANSQQTITTNLAANCPNCTQIEAVLKPLEDCICKDNSQILTVSPKCDSCELKADFTYAITEECELNITNRTVGTNLMYNWTMKAIDGTVLATSTLQNPVFTQLTVADFILCLTVSESDNPNCSDELCKDISMCCIEDMPCDLDGNITMTFNDVKCEYFFVVNTNISGNVLYSWQITEPNGNIITFPNNTNNITFAVNQTGTHQVQVIAKWQQGSKDCLDTLIMPFELKTCEPDCKFEGELKLKDADECQYTYYIDNGIIGANYTWNVIAPDGSNVTSLNPNNTTFTFSPQITGIYTATVFVSWQIDGFMCYDTLKLSTCLDACVTPCEYKGEITVDFKTEKCLFIFGLSNFSTLTNASVSWSVIDPNNNSVIYQTFSTSEIAFQPTVTGMYQVEVRISWQDGDEKCEKNLKLNRNLAACKEPCQFEGQIELKEADCEYMAFVPDLPNSTNLVWNITDNNNQIINNTPNQNFTMFRVPTEGVYTIQVTLEWKEDNEICKKVLTLTRCLESCKK